MGKQLRNITYHKFNLRLQISQGQHEDEVVNAMMCIKAAVFWSNRKKLLKLGCQILV
jgi:hypothetical protein